jgi:hypothetical protein
MVVLLLDVLRPEVAATFAVISSGCQRGFVRELRLDGEMTSQPSS